MYQEEGPDSMPNPEVGKAKRHLLKWGVVEKGASGQEAF